VTIEGGLHSPSFPLAPSGAARLRFDTFKQSDETGVNDADDFAHAFHSTAMSCRDTVGQVHNAQFR
jgi:hypothetical protein